MNFRRIGALWIALLFAAAANLSPASARATHAPDVTAGHCLENSIPSPKKPPCGGEDCCPLCGHSQNEPDVSLILSTSNAVAYAPSNAASHAFRASQSPFIEGFRARARAAPRAPPRFS